MLNEILNTLNKTTLRNEEQDTSGIVHSGAACFGASMNADKVRCEYVKNNWTQSLRSNLHFIARKLERYHLKELKEHIMWVDKETNWLKEDYTPIIKDEITRREKKKIYKKLNDNDPQKKAIGKQIKELKKEIEKQQNFIISQNGVFTHN